MLSIPAPPYPSGTATPISPSSAICRTSSSGKRPVSSSSAAFGSTSFWAKFRVISWIICCSSVRSKTISLSPGTIDRRRRDLSPPERSLPLFEKGGPPPPPVLGREYHRERVRLERAGISEVEVQAAVHRHLRHLHGDRPLGKDLRGDLTRRGHEVRRGDDPVDDPDLVRSLGRNHLPGQDKFLREVPPDQPGKALGTSVPRDDPQVHLGLAEPRVVGGDEYVACHREFASPSQGVPVDDPDDRLGHPLHEFENPLPEKCQVKRLDGGKIAHLGDVRPGHERLLPGAGEQHHPHVFT